MAYITRTTGTPTDRKKFTYSAWLKLANIETYQRPIQNYVDGNNRGYILYTNTADSANNTWFFYDRIGAQINFQANSVAKYRDTNGFYHLVVRADTTQSTQADRYRVYINGEQIDLSITTNIGQNVDLGFNSPSANLRIGGQESGSEPWKGIMSHVHFCDGYSYAPTEFGSTDATTGEWKINTSPSVTYGNNGYFVFKDDAAVTDRSGQGNNFTMSGSITPTVDNPSNVFATMNSLNYTTSALTYSNGNTTVSFPGAWVFALGNIGVSSGKWYWEAKVNSGNNANSYYGICAEMVPAGNGFYNNSQNGAIMYAAGDSGDTYIDGSYTSGAQTPQNKNTDILGLALDLDSGTKTLKIYKNGTQLTSGGTVNLSSYYNDTLVFPCFSGNSSSASCSFNVNFGNGYFGTTAVSSAGTNASNIGIFEYDVPTGYTALSTKGLNE